MATTLWASQAIPIIKVAKVALISIKVLRALLCSGSLNKATESDIASSPVKDALPLAKAFKTKSIAAKLSNP